MLWNARSLNNKLHHLTTELLDGELDAAFITETWFKTQLNNCTATLKENGFSISHFHRDNKGGGGVAVIYRHNFKLHSSKSYSFDTFECIFASISGNMSQKINFIVVYRFCELSPAAFLLEFREFIESTFIHKKNLVILGDFNLHVNKVFEPDIIQFNEILSTFGLSQLIDQPTHVSGNTLDLLITNKNETEIKDIVIDDINFSDHSYIFFKIPCEFQKSKDKVISIKTYKNIDMDKFKNDIVSKVNIFSGKNHVNFGDALNDYNALCENAVKDYVFVKSINVTESRPKWMDSEYTQVRTHRRKLYKRWIRTRNEEDRIAFVSAREKTHLLSIEKQSKFYRDTICNAKNSQKALFSICNHLLDMSKSKVLPSHTSPIVLANKFNDYFIEKIEKIRQGFRVLTRPLMDGLDTYLGPVMTEFALVSPECLKKIVLSKPIKSSPEDPLPGFLFKNCLDQLLPALTELVNLSLSTGSMEGLKDSIITPILKKVDSDSELLKNYRPVCNTLYLSKTIERTVLVQANDHMDRTKAHTPNQSGYKPFHSCETLLLKVTNDIFTNLDNSKCSIAVLLDLSAAFDTVDHDELLSILWSQLGFRGTVFQWFENFLGGRKQAVIIDGHKSEFRNNRYGVPQGSVIGPFLFNIYVRGLMRLMEEEGFSAHGYADDHQFLFRFQIDFQATVVRGLIPRSIDLINKWMNRYFLKLNPSKTQVIVFHPDSKHSNIAFSQLILSDCSRVQISKQVYNLGVTLDSKMSFSPHISASISQGYRLIRNITGIRKFISRENLKTLVNSIIIAKFDNCNSLYAGISAYDTGRLRKFQNSCARLIYNKKKRDHVSGILQELHWLPCEARTFFKIVCYVFKCIHNLAPVYLSELLSIKQPLEMTLCVPRTLTTYGDRAFSCIGPKLWNSLPIDIRLISSLDSFKSKLKHYFFNSFTDYRATLNMYRTS